MDVHLPPTFTDEGLRAALQARSTIPSLPVLVLSQYVEQIYARGLLADGTGGIGTCSRTGCWTVISSPAPYAGQAAAAPRWTPR